MATSRGRLITPINRIPLAAELLILVHHKLHTHFEAEIRVMLFVQVFIFAEVTEVDVKLFL